LGHAMKFISEFQEFYVLHFANNEERMINFFKEVEAGRA
jgi:hypothetical protein